MQKKIIALAIAGLMSGAAFAQSNVTISGVLDAGVVMSKNEGANRSTNAGYNNTATSVIAFRAQEDLGGGMKAGAFLETDIRGANVAPNSTFADFQRYVYVNGGWGELSLGQRTNFSTTTAVAAQPFGTSMGGGYTSTFGRLRGGGFEATGAYAGTAGRDVRAEGSVRYDSPNFNGFTFGVSWKPENAAANETAASNGHLNLGLNYSGGPLNVSYAHAKITNATAAAASTLVSGACTAAQLAAGGVSDALTGGSPVCVTGAVAAYDSSIKHNLLAANYTFGAATVYLGYSDSKADTTAVAGDEAKSAAWNLAVKYAVSGNVDLMANYMKDNDKLAANADRKLIGLGADYKFSKRTAAYLRYQSTDTNTNAAGGKNTQYAVGLRHAF